jgi:hypothetical protein
MWRRGTLSSRIVPSRSHHSLKSYGNSMEYQLLLKNIDLKEKKLLKIIKKPCIPTAARLNAIGLFIKKEVINPKDFFGKPQHC